MKHIKIFSSIMAILLLMACNNKPDSESGHSDEQTAELSDGEETGHKEEEGVVEITQAQAETVGLEMKPLEQKNLGNTIKVTGQLELFPQDRANISPFVGGNVRSINVIEGDKVNRGQVLAYLEHPDIITMQQEFQEKNDELVFLEQDFERKKILYEKGVSSGKEFQLAQSKFRSTMSSVNGLRSKLKLLGINTGKVLEGQIYSAVPITSPISGFVDEVMVSLGDYVAPQTKMFTVSDNTEIHADFKVYEKDIHKVKEGQEIYFTVASKPDELLKAKIHAIGKTFETDPKALHVHADVHNEDKELLPGMYVEGRIAQDEKMVYAVPEEAIIKDGEQSFIFILDEDGEKEKNKMKFKMIPISTGITDLGFVEINLPADMPKEAKVVTKGAYTLSSEMVKGELEHDH
ncbi:MULTISPECIES: efflux RND transporter periplasmic adaptor subunit [Aequorivita]|uniref:Efflux RND transporter periplasmic adaptor subunit n=1 Tax=Aequorivita iocasae TaxID=2803865 RepID=A0ABX7DWU9_9FLAO|nr:MULTISPECIES: efflux RND transporter periplasmic adaptor subunit [Aequorivita]QQX78068.1 efflux RND transporter periplasmic adaptor subunit [Aequorivita iocasae]UCA57576.1 efflux RND transporter periplasmic adaptor subunit [Aequorivita sp. F7]